MERARGCIYFIESPNSEGTYHNWQGFFLLRLVNIFTWDPVWNFRTRRSQLKDTFRLIETGPLAVSLSRKLIVGKLSRYCKISHCPTDPCNQATVTGRQWLKKHLVMTLTTTTNNFLLGKLHSLVLCCQVGPGPASQLSSATGARASRAI